MWIYPYLIQILFFHLTIDAYNTTAASCGDVRSQESELYWGSLLACVGSRQRTVPGNDLCSNTLTKLTNIFPPCLIENNGGAIGQCPLASGTLDNKIHNIPRLLYLWIRTVTLSSNVTCGVTTNLCSETKSVPTSASTSRRRRPSSIQIHHRSHHYHQRLPSFHPVVNLPPRQLFSHLEVPKWDIALVSEAEGNVVSEAG